MTASFWQKEFAGMSIIYCTLSVAAPSHSFKLCNVYIFITNLDVVKHHIGLTSRVIFLHPVGATYPWIKGGVVVL